MSHFLPSDLGGFYGQTQYFFGENAQDVAVVGKKDGSGLRLGYAQGPANVALAYASTKYLANGNVSSVNFAGSYDLGVAKLMAVYNRDNDKTPTEIKGTGYLLGASAPVGLGEFKVSYSSYKRVPSAGLAPKVDKLAVGYVYNLSKRTALYTTVAFLKNKNGAASSLNGSVSNANGNSTGLDFGLRHSF